MAIHLITPLEYRNAIERLRPFADGFNAKDGYDLRSLQNDLRYPSSDSRHFEVHLTRGQKQKVKNYYDELQKHEGYKPVRFQKFRDKKKLKSAQRAMGMRSSQDWRGVFVPVLREDVSAKNISLKQYTGKNQYGEPVEQWVVEYSDLGVDAVYLPFDKKMFAIYGTDYVKGLIDAFPSDWRYNLSFGEGREDLFFGGVRRHLLESLDYLAGRYSACADFITGIWVYRGAGYPEFNLIRLEKEKSRSEKRARQEIDKKNVISERKKLERLKARKHKENESQKIYEKEKARRIKKGIPL